MVSDHELIVDVSLYHITHSALECPEFALFGLKKYSKKFQKPLRASMVFFLFILASLPQGYI